MSLVTIDRTMKKALIILCAVLLGASAVVATEIRPVNSNQSSSRGVKLPQELTGTYFNGNNFVYVKNGWVRIVFNGNNSSSNDYNYTVEKDPWGGYVLKLDNGECITINGNSLYYNNTTYSKR